MEYSDALASFDAFSAGALRRSVLQVCVSREFTVLADRTSRVTSWLKALAAQVSVECDGGGVGVVGMCLTGGFALATALDPAVLAAVMSQPE